jgi:hypothetical protein
MIPATDERGAADALLAMSIGALLEATETGSPKQLHLFARGARAAADRLDAPGDASNRTRPMAAAMLREAANRAELNAHRKAEEQQRRAAERAASRQRPRLAVDNTEERP